MKKKTAIVTGASEGIGREFALQLAKEGYSITAVARGESRLKELLKELGTDSHTFLVADLSQQEGVSKVVAELKKSRYDLLINNAGFGVYGKFAEAPLEKLQSMTRVNCDALVALSHAYLQTAKSGDALVNVASTLSFLPMPSSSLYAATKAFVLSLSESLWYEQRKKGVYVMALCPGATESEFHKRAGGKKADAPPASITQTSHQVVATALSALKKRRKPTIISGIQNRALATFTRFVPRKEVVSIMGRVRSD